MKSAGDAADDGMGMIRRGEEFPAYHSYIGVGEEEFRRRAQILATITAGHPWVFPEGDEARVRIYVRETKDISEAILEEAVCRVMGRERIGNPLGAIKEAAKDIGDARRQPFNKPPPVPSSRQLTEPKADPEQVIADIAAMKARWASKDA